MPEGLRIFLTVIISLLFGIPAAIVLFAVTGVTNMTVAVWIGLIFGLLYGMEAGLLLIYDLDSPLGWVLMIADLTWSLPNTVFGFVLGNLIYPWIAGGPPSQKMSKNQGWIVYDDGVAGGGIAGGNQTLGNVNLGGAGLHEKVHLLQARAFGPFYLPVFLLNYIFNFAVQCLFSITIGMILWQTGTRDTPYFKPDSKSHVKGFWGWIYWANLFELWAFSTH
ncbi:MAG TPA: hypothetical protein VGO50_01420 [Pyrinomonadaceae bacterium]|jgi:hypothetical protein|nr:hypothetical protein [Pyrinomonadaceae bacterium]